MPYMRSRLLSSAVRKLLTAQRKNSFLLRQKKKTDKEYIQVHKVVSFRFNKFMLYFFLLVVDKKIAAWRGQSALYTASRGFPFFSFKFAYLLKNLIMISGRRSEFSKSTLAELSCLKNEKLNSERCFRGIF